MTREQAFQIIDQALAQVNTTRQGHLLLNQALATLAEVKPKEEELDASKEQ